MAYVIDTHSTPTTHSTHSTPKLKLTINLIPKPCWGANLRAALPKHIWDKLRRETYRINKHQCEICGAGKDNSYNHPVECHEHWSYNDDRRIQTFEKLQCLCPDCHQVKHMGHTISLGPQKKMEVINHFIKVNGITPQQAHQIMLKEFAQFHSRGRVKWKTNVRRILKHRVIAGLPYATKIRYKTRLNKCKYYIKN